MEKKDPRKVVAAVAAAIQVIIQNEMKAPPLITLPEEVKITPSPWRFVGRKELMDSRVFVQMRFMRR